MTVHPLQFSSGSHFLKGPGTFQAWGLFLESPGNFSGPKIKYSNRIIKNKSAAPG